MTVDEMKAIEIAAIDKRIAETAREMLMESAARRLRKQQRRIAA